MKYPLALACAFLALGASLPLHAQLTSPDGKTSINLGPAAASPLPPPFPAATAPATPADQLAELRRFQAELKRKEDELKAREDRLNAATQPAATQPADDPAPPQPELVPQPMFDPFTRRPNPNFAEQHDAFAARLTDKDVADSMKRGLDALLKLVQDSAQKLDDILKNPPRLPNGQVSPISTMMLDRQYGELALGVYALLDLHKVLGDERCHFASPEMSLAVKKVVECKTFYTYTLANQAAALAMLPNKPEFRVPLAQVRDALIRGARNQGNYTYYAPALDGKYPPAYAFATNMGYDNSNSQYGLLGVWAADDAGVETRNVYWKQVDTHWRKTQEKDGGWGYYFSGASSSPGQPGRPGRSFSYSRNTMTAAGVASLFVTMDHLDSGLRLDPIPDMALQSGLNWLDRDFEQSRLMLGTNLYLAYALERVGLASGLKYFGKYNWYRQGAASIIAAQRPTGEWTGGYGEITCTSYALLFLARGRSPVVVNKLAWGGPWNARPRDAANLKRWLVKRTERALNFQIVELSSDPDDWLDAPILLITGHGDPKFTPDQLAKLRHFALAGGTIFSTADGSDAVFTEAIRKKYAPAIADKQYEMRTLPPDHPIFTLDYRLDPGRPLTLYGLSNGIRELWVHSPIDMGGAWQIFANAKKECWEVPANLYFYVSGRASLRNKLDSVLVPPPKAPPTETLNLALLQYAGNSDPEPAAFPRLARLAAYRHNTALTSTLTLAGELDAAKIPIAHLTGTTPVTYTDKERQSLRTYLQSGGFLFIDAAAGSEPFGESIKALFAQILPEAKLEPLDPSDHPVTTGQLTGGERLASLELRKFCTPANGTTRRPYIYQLKLEGRPVALFYEADITSGLLYAFPLTTARCVTRRHIRS